MSDENSKQTEDFPDYGPDAVKMKSTGEKPKRKWVVLPFLWGGFKRVCFMLGFMILFSSLISIYTLAQFKGPPVAQVPDTAVLYLEFKDAIREVSPQVSFMDPFAARQPTVADYVKAIDAAADDGRIKGIVARMYNGDFSMAHVQEIRMAMQRFKARGKWSKIYSTSYGEGGGGIGRFYLASVFGERWMQPMGIVSISGVRAEVPFLRGVLDKVGIQPQFFQRKEYKSAYESVTRNEMSDQNREMMGDIVGGMKEIILRDVPADLGMDVAAFEALVDKGLFTSEAALAAGLITDLNYVDLMADQIETDLLGDPESEETLFVGVGAYLTAMNLDDAGAAKPSLLAKAKQEASGKPQIAVVYAVGAIMSTNGEERAKNGIAAAEVIAPILHSAAKDDLVKAVVLRIDSPGGSPSASETILRAVEKVKQHGKPVIVSMGPTAASGGYWIAASADRIFAMPSTLTGSIGVVGGKVAAQELWNNLGVNWDYSVSWGENAGIWSFNTPFSESEAAQFELMLDHVYDSFVSRVAKGRGMSVEAVDAVAKGRVWTGQQAMQRGLVDELGGLVEAVNYAAVQIGEEDLSGVDIVTLPRPKTFSEQIVDLLARSGSVYEGMRMQGEIAGMVAPYMTDARMISSGEPALAYEPLRVR